MKIRYTVFAIALLAIVAFSAWLLWVRFSPQKPGYFISTYVPSGWQVETDTLSTRVTSPDLTFADPAVIEDCTGATNSGCAINAAEPVMASGALFMIQRSLACRESGKSEIDWQTEFVKRYKDFDAAAYTFQGKPAVRFSNKGMSNTDPSYPVESRNIVVLVGEECQYIDFMHVLTPGANYGSEFGRFVEGLTFVSH